MDCRANVSAFLPASAGCLPRDNAEIGGASTTVFAASGVDRPTGHRSVVPSLEPVGDVDAARGCGQARRSPGLAEPDESESAVGGHESFCRAHEETDPSLSFEFLLSFDSCFAAVSRCAGSPR
jgi:hypothetical protein